MPTYQALGQWHQVTLVPLKDTVEGTIRLPGRTTTRRALAAAEAGDSNVIARKGESSSVLRLRISDFRQLAVVQGTIPAPANAGTRRGSQVPISTYVTQTLATETAIVEGLRQADLEAAKAFGASIVEEGFDGKVLLRVDSVEAVFGLVDLLVKREVGSVTPNFLRRIVPVRRSTPKAGWSHAKIGVPAAWKVTRGSADIRVAVLDEGVDTTHPAL